jgi:hypothetical protein
MPIAATIVFKPIIPFPSSDVVAHAVLESGPCSIRTGRAG